ncbi:ABC transporter permease [Halobaculum sp. MBLA0147]|uniref:ABC transporter permease n=1 Tax=Halobaculum sp. MBLA0147 TaxID=3079934 RepID=UPI0035268122
MSDAGSTGVTPGDDGDGGGDLATRLRTVLDRLTSASARERVAISVSALLLSVAVGAVLIYTAGLVAGCSRAAFFGSCYDPLVVYDQLFLGAFGNPLADPTNGKLATTLGETTILVFTGLSVAVAFKAGVFNIGTQGQMVVGGLATAVVTYAASQAVTGLVGTLVILPLGVATGAVFGGLYGAIPGALKAYADANEVITTIMLNFVATNVVLYLVQAEFKDPESFATQTRTLPAFAQFPRVVFPETADFSVVALALAITLAVAAAYLLAATAFGYDVRTSGLQPPAAEYGGVDASRTVVAAMTLSGALGGIGGAAYVMMKLGNFQTNVPAYGFDGITVTILAGNNPIGVLAAGLLFGVLKSGSINVSVATDVPPELVGVIRGLIVLFVAMPEFFRLLGRRYLPDDAGSEAVATDGGRPVGDTDGPETGDTAADATTEGQTTDDTIPDTATGSTASDDTAAPEGGDDR